MKPKLVFHNRLWWLGPNCRKMGLANPVVRGAVLAGLDPSRLLRHWLEKHK